MKDPILVEQSQQLCYEWMLSLGAETVTGKLPRISLGWAGVEAKADLSSWSLLSPCHTPEPQAREPSLPVWEEPGALLVTEPPSLMGE